jgi:thiamine-monophosphate kinase
VASGEFARIDRFLAAFRAAGGRTSGGSVVLGPGDDAAVYASPSPTALTTDALFEEVHFRRVWTTPEDLGHKALAVNVSDLAAMGARPTSFLCALGVPDDVDDAYLERLARGMAPLAARVGCVLAGGNFSRASELSLTITALGAIEHRTLRRDTARVGDAVILVGDLGEAAAELRLLMAGTSLPPGHSALNRPQPLVREGLAAARVASCAIDVSDGLVQDLGHVARASGVRLVIDDRRVPRSARFDRLTQGLDAVVKVSLVYAGGEDYALAVIGDGRRADDFGGVIIGRVEEGRGVEVEGLPPGTRLAGHDHFAR